MNVLVTGAAGFIGSHLIEWLIDDGVSVTGLDDLSTGQMENLANVADHPNFRMIRGSILDRESLDEATSDVDTVFHLAAAVGAFVIQERPLRSLLTNIHGTENVVDAAHRRGCRLLLASTSEIYGKNPKPGLHEEDDRILGSPLRSRWTYSEAKAIDESLVDGYVREHGLRAVIVRLFNTVGPRQTGRYGMVIPRLVTQALEGRPLTVFGSGEQVRCFCHVADVVPALVRLVDEQRAYGSAVNLGGSQPISIEELAARVISLTGSRSETVRVSYQDAYGAGYEDMPWRMPDCTRARELVGFRPERSLDDVLRAVIEERAHARPMPRTPTLTRDSGV